MKKVYVLVSGNDPTYATLKEAEEEAKKVIQEEGLGVLFVAEVRKAIWVERKL